MSLLYDMEEQEAAEKQGQKAAESEAWKPGEPVQSRTEQPGSAEMPQRNRQQSTAELMELVHAEEQRSAAETPVEAGRFRTPGHGISGQPIPGDSERGSQARPELAEVPMIHAASETTGSEEAREFTESPSPEPGRIPDVAQQAVQNAVQNTVRETVEKTLQNTVEKRTEHIIEKKIEKETEKKVQQTAEQAFQKAEGQKVLQTAVEQHLPKTRRTENAAEHRGESGPGYCSAYGRLPDAAKGSTAGHTGRQLGHTLD